MSEDTHTLPINKNNDLRSIEQSIIYQGINPHFSHVDYCTQISATTIQDYLPEADSLFKKYQCSAPVSGICVRAVFSYIGDIRKY